ncbi:SAUR-like auxin-responsive protein family [Zostera marina]|uniref:SAUR-like auxin-responsive protein family n=1 Tax=Zostera marina TaxID=29655 RepID=A0A0K9Q509_ZOSMR|nr:SAUR-like auxin-responsive protein family [Zostera marina]
MDRAGTGRICLLISKMMCMKINKKVSPKGFVPMLVGVNGKDEEREKFLVHIKLLDHPDIRSLLKMSEREFGYRQTGIINIPCDAASFRRLLHSCKN